MGRKHNLFLGGGYLKAALGEKLMEPCSVAGKGLGRRDAKNSRLGQRDEGTPQYGAA